MGLSFSGGSITTSGLSSFLNVSRVSVADQWREESARRGIPEPDSNPLVGGGRSVCYVWRRHYVAALIDEADRPALQSLDDLGFEVIRFEDPESWRAAFARLAAALGHLS